MGDVIPFRGKNNPYSGKEMGDKWKMAPEAMVLKAGQFEVITGHPPCQAFASTPRLPLYNVYQHDRLVYGAASFIQCTRFMAMMVGDPTGMVTLAEVFAHGYTLKAIG
jgi:hypothetical protein